MPRVANPILSRLYRSWGLFIDEARCNTWKQVVPEDTAFGPFRAKLVREEHATT
jgi:hypothetical protein